MPPLRALVMALCAVAWTAAASAQPTGSRPHHAITIELDPDANRLEGRDTITLDGGGELDLHLLPALQVARVAVDGRSQEIARDGETLTVELGQPGAHRVEVAYVGRLAPQRLQERLGPVVQTAGSYLPPQGGWYPQAGRGRITYEIAVTVPEGQRALATGRELTNERVEGRRRTSFAADYPSQGPAVFAGRYSETVRTPAGVTLRTLFPAGRDGGGDLAASYLDSAERYLRHYQAVVGPYPYPAFSVVAAPFPVGLGFEGATYVSERILDLPYMKGRSLAHEILHSWWGGAVGIAFQEGNWAEGLTTYLADHWVTGERDLAAAEELRRQWLRDFAALPDSRRQPLTAFTGKLHDADQVTGYNKAAMLFHMLRHRIGPETFEAALAGFYDANRFETASWADLKTAFEAAAGTDLDGFFEQWLTRPGAPTLRIADAERKRTADGWSIALGLAQSAPEYALQVPVEVATEAGTARIRVPLERHQTNTVIQLDAKPTALSVDPHADLFRELPNDQAPLSLRHLTLDPATRVVALDVPEDAALQLAGRLLDTEAETLDADAAASGTAPLLVVATPDRLDGFLERAGFGAPPSEVAGRGTLRVWTAEAGGRRALIVITDDPGALTGAARRLGYYLRESWLVVDGGEVAARGTWPTGPDPLRVEFGE